MGGGEINNSLTLLPASAPAAVLYQHHWSDGPIPAPLTGPPGPLLRPPPLCCSTMSECPPTGKESHRGLSDRRGPAERPPAGPQAHGWEGGIHDPGPGLRAALCARRWLPVSFRLTPRPREDLSISQFTN